MELICSHCHCVFKKKKIKPSASNKYYCTYKCSVEGKKKRSSVNCNICEKSFEKLNKDIARSNFHYCSRDCWHKKRAENNLNCIKCNQEIDRSKLYTSKKYCYKCYIENYKVRFPDKVNKFLKHKVRIKRNLPLDHPPLRKFHDKEEGYFTASGYKRIYRKGHFGAKRKNGDMSEHVWVMCEYLKRPLFENENIHHKNGIRFDNRIENLELWTRGQPAGQRVRDRITYYKEFLEKYECKVELSPIAQKLTDDESGIP